MNRMIAELPEQDTETESREIVTGIRAAMVKQGVTQIELAKRLGITPSAASTLLNGRHEVSIKMLRKLATALGLTLSISLRAE